MDTTRTYMSPRSKQVTIKYAPSLPPFLCFVYDGCALTFAGITSFIFSSGPTYYAEF